MLNKPGSQSIDQPEPLVRTSPIGHAHLAPSHRCSTHCAHGSPTNHESTTYMFKSQLSKIIFSLVRPFFIPFDSKLYSPET